MSTPTPKHPTAPAARPAGKNPSEAGAHKPHRDDDEVLHVPRGVSRGTFLFLVFMIIFLMVIWLVPGSIMDTFGPEKNPVTVRFELPGGRRVEWRHTDMLVAQRAIMDAFAMDFLLPYQLGIDASKPSPQELTRLLVLDEIARDEGIEITDADLAGHLRGLLEFSGRATPEDFKASVRARGLDQIAVEESIRRVLRVVRFQQLVGFAGAVPDPAKIEEQWHDENIEFAFDYATLPVADLKEEARKELPDEAGLAAWFEKLDEGAKEDLKTPEKRTAELAFFRDTETTPAAELLAAYPEKPPEGTEATAPEELAVQYHRRVYFRRFAKPKPAEGEEASTDLYFKFEDVKDVCLAEAPVYFAMQRWIEYLNARRTNGETIDFSAEAQRLGLEHRPFETALTREEFAADEATGNEDLADTIFATDPDGSFHPSPFALPQGLAVVRTNSRVEPELPPFESIREKVAEKWLEPKAEELAQARLAKLREGLEKFEPAPPETKDGEEAPPPDTKAHYRATAEAFQAAVSAAGLAVRSRDYVNKSGAARKNAPAEDEEPRALTTQAYTWGLYELETDEVAEPGLSPDKATAYVVRLSGKRDVPLDDMTPTQYDRYKESARSKAMHEIGKGMDLDFLRKSYGLWLYEDSEEAESQAAEASKKSAGS
jgi:hypothetical protein